MHARYSCTSLIIHMLTRLHTYLYIVVTMQGKRLYPFIKLPTQKELLRFMGFAGPVFIFVLCKIVVYTAMTMTVTASNDNVLLAAHTCMLKIYFLFTAFGDSGGQTGTYTHIQYIQ